MIVNMKIINIICIAITIFFFYQCKTSQLDQIEINLKKTSENIKFLNKEEFEESRNLIFNKLSSNNNLLKNDTIIFLEYFFDGTGGYHCTIYESKNRIINRYSTQKSIKNKAIHIDSLVVSKVPDKIFRMVLDGQLDEIEQRGDATTLTPAATLIINIGVKDKEKNKFSFKTLITQEFSTYEKK